MCACQLCGMALVSLSFLFLLLLDFQLDYGGTTVYVLITIFAAVADETKTLPSDYIFLLHTCSLSSISSVPVWSDSLQRSAATQALQHWCVRGADGGQLGERVSGRSM